MARWEEVELTNMCMVCDGNGNVLVQNKKNNPVWHGWNFPGGHVEKGELKSSGEGEVFWYPLSQLALSDKLIDGFGEMLRVFTSEDLSEVFYERKDGRLDTVFC